MSNDIRVPKWVWMTGIPILLFIVGLLASPLDKDNHPLLLLPDVKAMEDYRRSLVSWHERLNELDRRLAQILSSGTTVDLFSQSSEGQKIQTAAMQILQEIEQTGTPLSGIPAREMALSAGRAYSETSQLVLAWVSAPTATNLKAAKQSLLAARNILSKLEASQWIEINLSH